MIFRKNTSKNNYVENVNMKMEDIMKSNKICNLKVRVSEEEYEIIKQKCEETDCSNMSSYLRRMALQGTILVYPKDDWRKIIHLISNISNNVNQVAVKLHITEKIYDDDIKIIKESLDDVNKILYELQLKLSKKF